MSVLRRSRLSLTAALFLACSSDTVVGPGGRFDHAVATFACGPADGPALAIYLAPDPITSVEPSGVYVRAYVPGTVAEVTGKVWPISSNSAAAAWFHRNGGDFEIATGGYLTIASGSAGSTIVGSVDLWFSTAGHVHGPFHADWVANNVLCG